VGQIFKKLISIDQKPDITLNLLSSAHFRDLFTCLAYLDENQAIEMDIDAFFERQSRFNNYLGLSSPEVIDNINNNFRISLLRDFVIPNFLSESQINEMNTFVLLHNNTILCHIDSVMGERMANLDKLIDEKPRESLEFFTELFGMLRGSFTDLKANFSQNFLRHGIHEKVLAVLLRELGKLGEGRGAPGVQVQEAPRKAEGGCASANQSFDRAPTPASESRMRLGEQGGPHPRPEAEEEQVSAAEAKSTDQDAQEDSRLSNLVIENSMEAEPPIHQETQPPPPQPTPSSQDNGGLILQVCMEIIGFLVRSFPKALPKILVFRSEGKTLIERLPEWTQATPGDFPHQVLDLFRIQPVIKGEDLEPECIDCFVEDVIPYLSTTIKQLAPLSAYPKFVDFCLELFILFFSFGAPRLNAALMSWNVVNEIWRALSAGLSKWAALRSLKYMKEHLNLWKEGEEAPFDVDFVFRVFVDKFLARPVRRENLLRSLSLGVVQVVGESPDRRLAEALLRALEGREARVMCHADICEMIDKMRAGRGGVSNGRDTPEVPPKEDAPAGARQEAREWGAEEPSELATAFQAGIQYINITIDNPERERAASARRRDTRQGRASDVRREMSERPNSRRINTPGLPESLLGKRDQADD